MNSTQGKEAQIGKRYHWHGWVSIENFAQNFLGFEMEKAWGCFSGDGWVGSAFEPLAEKFL
jgi:hypothetical protein